MSQLPAAPLPVTIDDIRTAASTIGTLARRTPVLTSRSFNEACGKEVYFKCENFQRGGAFKIRGASNFLLTTPREQLDRGVVTYSSGNHAQALAIACCRLGVSATIVMPQDAPKAKWEATRAYGPRIVLYDRARESREEIGNRIVAETGATLVPPFDHPKIVTGQGTAALELLGEVPGLDAIVAPIGGGGLLSGSAIAAKGLAPGMRVYGVEPEKANDTYLSFRKGSRVSVTPDTIADGLRAPMPGKITFPIIQKLVDDIVLVSEEEIKSAVKFLLLRLKILVEPSGAVAAAAVFFRRLPEHLRRVGVILSGGNVDWEDLVGF